RLEDRLQPVEHFTRESRECRTAVIDGRLRQREQDALGHIGGAGNLKEMPPAHHGHRTPRQSRYQTTSPNTRRASLASGARSAKAGAKRSRREGRCRVFLGSAATLKFTGVYSSI